MKPTSLVDVPDIDFCVDLAFNKCPLPDLVPEDGLIWRNLAHLICVPI
jgi:hypothetical protein